METINKKLEKYNHQLMNTLTENESTVADLLASLAKWHACVAGKDSQIINAINSISEAQQELTSLTNQLKTILTDDQLLFSKTFKEPRTYKSQPASSSHVAPVSLEAQNAEYRKEISLLKEIIAENAEKIDDIFDHMNAIQKNVTDHGSGGVRALTNFISKANKSLNEAQDAINKSLVKLD